MEWRSRVYFENTSKETVSVYAGKYEPVVLPPATRLSIPLEWGQTCTLRAYHGPSHRHVEVSVWPGYERFVIERDGVQCRYHKWLVHLSKLAANLLAQSVGAPLDAMKIVSQTLSPFPIPPPHTLLPRLLKGPFWASHRVLMLRSLSSYLLNMSSKILIKVSASTSSKRSFWTSASWMLSLIAMYPLDVAQTLTILGVPPPWRLSAIFAGLGPSLLHLLAFRPCCYLISELVNWLLPRRPWRDGFLRGLLYSVFIATTASSLLYPLDTVARYQILRSALGAPVGFGRACQVLYDTRGLSGFFTGCHFNALRIALTFALLFAAEGCLYSLQNPPVLPWRHFS
jgi:hypothetical protein